MKKVLPITSSKFPQKTFGVFVIIAIVAYLLTLKPVAERVKSLVEMLGITFPPMAIFQETAQNIFEFFVGAILVVLSVIALIISVKVGLIVSGLALVGYAGFRIYNTFVKGVTPQRLPDYVPRPSGKAETIEVKEKTLQERGYGPVSLNPKK